MLENVLNKRDDENAFEHHKRLVYGKLKDKTLSDYDYGELSKYLYGKELAPDETRKRMYGSYQTLEIMDELSINNISDSDLLSELDSKRIALQKEKQQFSDQRREFNKLVNKEGRREHLYDKLIEAANNLPDAIGLLTSPDTPKERFVSENEAVIVLSDWHYGMVTTNVWNVFDTEICIERVQEVLDEAIKKISLHKCHRAHIVLLGDLISGAIHCSTRVASEELVCEQLMHVSELVAQFVLKISEYVNTVDVYSTFGNHARTLPDKKDNLHMDNMERIVPWWLEQRIEAEQLRSHKNLDITVHQDDTCEFILFNVCGHGFCASHGDLDAVKTSPKLLSTLFRKTLGRDIETILLGDKHHGESFEEFGIEAILCGSLCGTDEYANNKRLYSKPTQLMLIVDPVHGVDARYRLRCE